MCRFRKNVGIVTEFIHLKFHVEKHPNFKFRDKNVPTFTFINQNGTNSVFLTYIYILYIIIIIHMFKKLAKINIFLFILEKQRQNIIHHKSYEIRYDNTMIY